MADNEIVLKIVGDASQATTALDAFNNRTKGLLNVLRNATRGFQDISAAFSMGRQAINAVVQPIEDAIKAYTDLAAQVRDLTRATGVSSEEASRMIETMGDLTIPTTTLKLAMREMINNGLNPTVESLAKLSDQYLAIKDPVQRAAFAMQNFGARGGLEMAKALELGGDELRRMNASVGENKILSEQAVKEARAFEMAQEDLNDVVEGFQIQIGKFLIPAVIQLIEGIISLTKSQAQLKDEMRDNTEDTRKQTKSFEEYRGAIEDANKEVFEYADNVKTVSTVVNASTFVFRIARNEILETTGASDELNYQIVLMHDRIDAVKDTTLKFSDAAKTVTSALNNMMAPALDDTADAATRLKDATDEYNQLSGGRWSTEQKNFIDRMKESQDKVDELRVKIEKLSKTPNLGEKGKEELAGYWEDLNNITGEMEDLKTAHKRATDTIVLGWIQAKLAADGVLDQTDIDILMDLSEQWGLITQEERDAYDLAIGYADWLKNMRGTVIPISFQTFLKGMGGFIPSESEATAASFQLVQQGIANLFSTPIPITFNLFSPTDAAQRIKNALTSLFANPIPVNFSVGGLNTFGGGTQSLVLTVSQMAAGG